MHQIEYPVMANFISQWPEQIIVPSEFQVGLIVYAVDVVAVRRAFNFERLEYGQIVLKCICQVVTETVVKVLPQVDRLK
jgi:hypothetical protein